MAVYMIFKYGKQFRYAPSFNNNLKLFQYTLGAQHPSIRNRFTVHSTLDFCPRPAMKEKHVPLNT